MTKQRKLGLALLIAIALSGGAWLTYSVTSDNTAADKGYELYLSGDTDGAFRYFSAEAEKDPQAAYALSVMYLNGYDAPANALLGYQWLERACGEVINIALVKNGVLLTERLDFTALAGSYAILHR